MAGPPPSPFRRSRIVGVGLALAPYHSFARCQPLRRCGVLDVALKLAGDSPNITLLFREIAMLSIDSCPRSVARPAVTVDLRADQSAVRESIAPGIHARRLLALRMPDSRDEIFTIELQVISAGAGLDEIRRGNVTFGFVQTAGRVFVALSGARADRAEECGQYLLWDQAAARLVSVHGLLTPSNGG